MIKMGTLNIKEIKKQEAQQLIGYDISLKVDGCLIFYIDGKLHSPRCERTERFKHIAKILKDGNFPNCMGEMYLDEPKSNVFDVSRSENWNKVKFMPFDLKDRKDLTFKERQRELFDLVMDLDSPFIKEMIKFESFESGWDYCLNNESEGLVLRNDYHWLKCKLLKEEKVEIAFHEVGKDKGTFILKNGSRISGTSIQYVEQYVEIKEKGNTAIAEVEYPFKTKEGKMFQPRLRQIVEVENE